MEGPLAAIVGKTIVLGPSLVGKLAFSITRNQKNGLW